MCEVVCREGGSMDQDFQDYRINRIGIGILRIKRLTGLRIRILRIKRFTGLRVQKSWQSFNPENPDPSL
jgi:hypothetical protein